MSSSSHGDKDGQDVEPEAEVRKPAERSQGADLRQKEADYDEDQRTNDVAEAVFGYLGDVLAKQDGHLTQQQQEGDGLEDIDDMASGCPPRSECQIAVIAGWKFMGVDPHEDPPEEVSGIHTENAESREDANSRAIAKRADGEWNSERTENIGGDLVSQLLLSSIALETLLTR